MLPLFLPVVNEATSNCKISRATRPLDLARACMAADDPDEVEWDGLLPSADEWTSLPRDACYPINNEETSLGTPLNLKRAPESLLVFHISLEIPSTLFAYLGFQGMEPKYQKPWALGMDH